MRGHRSAGYGFVALATLEAAQKACDALNSKELSGRNVVVEIAKPADQKDKEKAEIAKSYGADHVILYTKENTVQRVLEITNGEGVHAVYDGVGKDTYVHSRVVGECIS